MLPLERLSHEMQRFDNDGGKIVPSVSSAQHNRIRVDYIGTAEERAKMDMADEDDMVHVGPGHPIKLPGFGESAPQALKELMKDDVESSQFVASIWGNKE